MRWMMLLPLACLAGPACSRGGGEEGQAAREDDAFAVRWAAATATNAPIDVTSEQGSALAGDLSRGGGLVASALPQAEGDEPLAPDEVTRFVRTRLDGIQTCYARAARGQPGLRGRALLSFTVQNSGEVSPVTVDAPSFGGTGLDRCVESRVSSWRFRPFAGEPVAASYPLVFVGR